MSEGYYYNNSRDKRRQQKRRQSIVKGVIFGVVCVAIVALLVLLFVKLFGGRDDNGDVTKEPAQTSEQETRDPAQTEDTEDPADTTKAEEDDTTPAGGSENANVQAIAYYMTAKPNRFVPSWKFFNRQLEAIRCHDSQFPTGSEALSSLQLYLKLRSIDFGIRSFSGIAEGFRVLGKTHMHCLPEAK